MLFLLQAMGSLERICFATMTGILLSFLLLGEPYYSRRYCSVHSVRQGIRLCCLFSIFLQSSTTVVKKDGTPAETMNSESFIPKGRCKMSRNYEMPRTGISRRETTLFCLPITNMYRASISKLLAVIGHFRFVPTRYWYFLGGSCLLFEMQTIHSCDRKTRRI